MSVNLRLGRLGGWADGKEDGRNDSERLDMWTSGPMDRQTNRRMNAWNWKMDVRTGVLFSHSPTSPTTKQDSQTTLRGSYVLHSGVGGSFSIGRQTLMWSCSFSHLGASRLDVSV